MTQSKCNVHRSNSAADVMTHSLDFISLADEIDSYEEMESAMSTMPLIKKARKGIKRQLQQAKKDKNVGLHRDTQQQSENTNTNLNQGIKRKWNDTEDADNQQQQQKYLQQQSQAHSPWMRHDCSQYTSAIEMFTQEINDFSDYLMPTLEEHNTRVHVLKSVESFVINMWEDAKVFVFGSFHTKLYLPGSDLDIVVVLDNMSEKELKKLANEIRSTGFGINVEVILRTRVPIIKFQESKTGIDIDISYNQSDGFKTGAFIESITKEFPALRPLTLMVKHFLKLKPPAKKIDPMRNLGVLLIEFFELYSTFNYDDVIISVTHGGAYINKVKDPSKKKVPLTCLNPVKIGQNVTKGTKNMTLIRSAFADAYRDLTEAIQNRQKELDQNIQLVQDQSQKLASSRPFIKNTSMIDKVFQFPKYLKDQRDRINDKYQQGLEASVCTLGQTENEALSRDVDISSVGDGSDFVEQDENMLILHFRRHFKSKSSLKTIQEIANFLNPVLVAEAMSLKELGPLLDETDLQSMLAEIKKLQHSLLTCNKKSTGTKASKVSDSTPQSPAMLIIWKKRLRKLQNMVHLDKLRMVVFITRKSAQTQINGGGSQEESKTAIRLDEEASLLQDISERVIALFDTMDHNDPHQLADFYPQYLELMEHQAYFGLRQVELQEGIRLDPKDRAQLVEWSNSAVSDRLRSFDPIKMSKFEEALPMLNSQRKTGDNAVVACVGSDGIVQSKDAIEYYQVYDSDEE
ncbi:hypothetical protein FBU30_003614 [Linnemannia zychae]|nr:hypothetical protein FBU30_003614 [Linnemannia zychae]